VSGGGQTPQTPDALLSLYFTNRLQAAGFIAAAATLVLSPTFRSINGDNMILDEMLEKLRMIGSPRIWRLVMRMPGLCRHTSLMLWYSVSRAMDYSNYFLIQICLRWRAPKARLTRSLISS
jgi:hypothetical protein